MNRNITKQIEKELTNELVLETIEESIDIIKSTIFEEVIFEEIPFLGEIYKTGKFIISIPDRILHLKLIYFFNRLKENKISYDLRLEFYNNHQNDKESIGLKLLSIIDKADSISKAEIIGEAFSFCLINKISYSEFLRISHGVNSSFIDDLLSVNSSNKAGCEETKMSLMNSGFISITTGQTHGDLGQNIYSYNDLGKKFKEIIKELKKNTTASNT